jgi:hypothetical protein
MARNGSDNSGPVRDERGRYPKGIPGGPGRPLGSRNKLSEDFLCDIQEDWAQHGKEIFHVMREKFPEIYFQSMVKLALVHRVEIGQPKAFDKPRTVEEALDQLEQKVGPRGRREFEKFLRKMKRLEAGRTGKESMMKLPPTSPSRAQLDVKFVTPLHARRERQAGIDVQLSLRGSRRLDD